MANLIEEAKKTNKLKPTTNKTAKKSRLVAFLLCYVFGLFGAHRFYVGKTRSGVAFMLGWIVSLLGVAGALSTALTQGAQVFCLIVSSIICLAIIIIWIIDLILIILGEFKTANGYVVKKWIED